MTITCPACSARFRSPPEDVLSTGRPLQCGTCEHEWQPVSKTSGRMIVAAPAMVPASDDLMAPLDASLSAIPKQAERAEPIFVDALPEAPIPTAPFPRVALAAMALMFTGVLGIGFQDRVVAALPQAAPVYKMAGLMGDHPGLRIASVTTRHEMRDGIAKLIVRGEIENVASGPVPVPPLELTMRGEATDKLYAWKVAASTQELKPGEKGRFTAIAHGFPSGARDVKVGFSSDR